jgi:geranylgeranyl reductase family protein
MNNYDVLIVGGGPAGLSAGYYLTKKGYKVAVYDFQNYKNREKICGDGLTPRSVYELDKMNIDLNSSIFNKIKGLEVISDYSHIFVDWDKDNDFVQYGLTCNRNLLDNLLYNNAKKIGCDVFGSEKVTDIEYSQDNIIVKVKIKSYDKNDYNGNLSAEEIVSTKILIIAAGASGTEKLLKQIPNSKKALNSKIQGVAVRGYFNGGINAPTKYIQSFLPSNGSYGGYVWVFPLADGVLNVGIGIMEKIKKHKKTHLYYYKNRRTKKSSIKNNFSYRTLTKLLDDWVKNHPDIVGTKLTPVKGAKLPMGLREMVINKNVLLVGDSAGLVSPFNGEGVSYALHSGELASIAIDNYLKGITNDLNEYSKAIKKNYAGYFGMGRYFINIINNKYLMKLCVKYGLKTEFGIRGSSKILAHLYKKPSGITKILEILGRWFG